MITEVYSRFPNTTVCILVDVAISARAVPDLLDDVVGRWMG